MLFRSKQRVCQILKILDAGEGGFAIKAAERERKRAVKLASKRRQVDANCRARWGIGKDEYDELRALEKDLQKTPMYRFKHARRTKVRSGVDWQLTFPQWWKLWCESGKYERYGNDLDEYMLVRKKNKGAYRMGNVHIIPASEFFSKMNGHSYD